MRRWLPVILAIVFFLLGALALTYVAVYQRYSVSHSQTRIVRLDGLTGAIAVFDQTGKMLNRMPPINVYNVIKHDIDMDVEYNENACSGNSIAVRLKNGSQHDLLYATFKVDVRKKGSSSTLLIPQKQENMLLPQMYEGNGYRWDDIVRGGETLTLCYNAPKITDKKAKLSELEFSVYNIMFTFDGVENPLSDQDTLNRFGTYY